MINQKRLAVTALFSALGMVGTAHAQDAAAPVKMGKWNGSIRSTLVTVSNADPAGQTRFAGNAYVTQPDGFPEGKFKVELRVSSNRGSEMLEWALSQNRCGSPLTPIIPSTDLPQLELRPGGDAEIKFEGAFGLKAGSTYHIDIMRGGHAQNNIVACADLRYQKPDK